MPVKPKLKTI